MLNKLWIVLSGLLVVAMPSAQAGELNLYSMNTGSYVYHMTGNHGQYNEHFNNNFFLGGAQVFSGFKIQRAGRNDEKQL